MSGIWDELWYQLRYSPETVNLDRFANRYFEMKRLDAAQRAYHQSKLGLSEGHIRERALINVAKRGRQALADRAQGVGPRLSPETFKLLEDLPSKSDDLIQRVRRQNKDFLAERRARALIPRKERLAQLHRSSRDRTAAILGALERERRQMSALSRVSSERAKAPAASRRNKFAEGTFCHWWHNRKVTRKSVIIAKRLRRAPFSKFEERHARRHTKALIMEALCGSN